MTTSIILCLFIGAVCLYSTSGTPVHSAAEVFEAAEYEPAIAPHGERHSRATCDLLSVSTPIGSLNHAACAAHCLAMGGGRRGGRCIDGVCNCRF